MHRLQITLRSLKRLTRILGPLQIAHQRDIVRFLRGGPERSSDADGGRQRSPCEKLIRATSSPARESSCAGSSGARRPSPSVATIFVRLSMARIIAQRRPRSVRKGSRRLFSATQARYAVMSCQRIFRGDQPSPISAERGRGRSRPVPSPARQHPSGFGALRADPAINSSTSPRA